MSGDSDNQRIVELLSTPDLFQAESVVQELRAEGVNAQIEGKQSAGIFGYLQALDGTSFLKVVVLESDYDRARKIAARWLQDEEEEKDNEE